MPNFDKIVIITQPTSLDELVARYNTRDQAKFMLKTQAIPFEPYQDAHDAYRRSLDHLHRFIPSGVRTQTIDRGFLPTFLFGPRDLVVTLGRDGLVINTAKYLIDQPLLAFNPDPKRVDGVLATFPIDQAAPALEAALEGRLSMKSFAMAQARLNDGQTLYAVNDLFIGHQSHVSARYRIQFGQAIEDQSSSGLIISTGAGSTGWLRSVLAGAAGVVRAFAKEPEATRIDTNFSFDASEPTLYFSVREPFVSRTSQASLVFGRIEKGQELVLTSAMPQGGVVFSDGIEADRIEFTSGRIARVRVADRTVNLLQCHDRLIHAHR